jgi:DNA-binding MarR family transcriptional regulator
MRSINSIGYLLNHVSFVLGRQSDQVLQERLGIGFSQFKIMKTLQKSPHIQQKQIAECLGQTEASISRQIKLLQEQGLLQTVRRAENRREHITTLTAKGDRYTDEAISVLNDYLEPMFTGLSEKQQAVLLESLQILHQASCDPTKVTACHKNETTK